MVYFGAAYYGTSYYGSSYVSSAASLYNGVYYGTSYYGGSAPFTYYTAQWKCIYYDPDKPIKEAFINYQGVEFPENTLFYIGGSDQPNGTNITWEQMKEHYLPVPVNNIGVYVKMLVPVGYTVDFKELGSDGFISVEMFE